MYCMYNVCVSYWWFVPLVWYMYFLFGGCDCVNFVLVYGVVFIELAPSVGGVYYNTVVS